MMKRMHHVFVSITSCIVAMLFAVVIATPAVAQAQDSGSGGDAGGTATQEQAKAPAAEQFIDCDGAKIRVVTQGDAENEPVVLVHGFTANVEMMWQLTGLMDRLADDYYLIALDCRGHGKSAKPHDAAQYGEHMVADVFHVLDHLKIDKAHIVGYSMGGMIAYRCATDHPDRIISAVPAGFGWAPQSEEQDLMFDRIATALEERGSIRPLLEELTPPQQRPLLTDEQLDQMDMFIRMSNDTAALGACARGMIELRPDEAALARNEVPCLCLVGGDDPLKREIDTMPGRMTNLEVKVIENTDHMTVFSDPAFIDAIETFLKEHAATATAGVENDDH